VPPAPRASFEEACGALADAFLAARDWAAPDLSSAGARTVGRRPALVRSAVSVVLDGYPRAPRDAPRELSRFLAASVAFRRTFAASAARSPVRVLSRTAVPTSARPVARVPAIGTVPELARLLGVTVGHLDWFADTRGWNRRAPAGPLHSYRYEWRSRPGRTPRLLEAPLHLLRSAQRAVLDELLVQLPLHEAAHGFVAGRSALTGARAHTGRHVVVSVDLVSFFAAVPARRVFSIFRQAGLAESVAYALTGVCTHAVPVHVLRAMPPGGSPDERSALRLALVTPHLPQGAPSSPALANLTLRRLDSRLDGWARSADATYTRYADDLTFSGDRPLGSRADAFLRGVGRIVEDEGHALNPRKTRVRRRGVRQSVTGIVVNEHPSVGRREADALKAILHNCVRFGPHGQNRGGHADFRAHLSGRVGWVEQIHPELGARLRAAFEQIRWDGGQG
jgi:RNA-directed DNA polymerase